MAENQTPTVQTVSTKSKRDQFGERLKKKYPDREYADDEALFGQINDDYDDYDKELAGYRDREQKLSDMFTADPRSAYFLTSWRDGDDPAIALVRQFGTDIKEAIDDPERQEEIAAANKEFVERVAKAKELDEEYQSNLAESLQYLDQYQEENGLSDDEIDNIMVFLVGIIRDGIMGKFSPETIAMARKALNHDADVSEANHEGEVRGLNTKIEERLRSKSSGDGTPNLSGSNNAPTRQGKKTLNIFDYADAAK